MSVHTAGWQPFKAVSLEKHGALAHCIYMSDSLSINTLRIFCSPPIWYSAGSVRNKIFSLHSDGEKFSDWLPFKGLSIADAGFIWLCCLFSDCTGCVSPSTVCAWPGTFFLQRAETVHPGRNLATIPKDCSVIFSAVRNVVHPGTATKHGRLSPFSSHALLLLSLHQEYLFLQSLAQSGNRHALRQAETPRGPQHDQAQGLAPPQKHWTQNGLCLSGILLIFWPRFGWCFKCISAKEAEPANFCPSSALWAILQGCADMSSHSYLSWLWLLLHSIRFEPVLVRQMQSRKDMPVAVKGSSCLWGYPLCISASINPSDIALKITCLLLVCQVIPVFNNEVCCSWLLLINIF